MIGVMKNKSESNLLERFEKIEQIPSLPVVIEPLLRYLEQPVEEQETEEVVNLISHDGALAAQCLYMANSPLFGMSQEVHSLRSAVVALGFHRMREIAVSCCLLNLVPCADDAFAPTAFWEHSLACALVARRLARKVGFPDPEQAYLAGLLHDVGIVFHLWLIPQEFRAVCRAAQSQQLPLHEVEREVLGFTHAQTGELLAQRWKLSPELVEVVARHHDPASAEGGSRALVALVSVSDLLCRMCALGHGYDECLEVNFSEESAFTTLRQDCPKISDVDWARFTFELDGYVEEVRRLVSLLYRRH